MNGTLKKVDLENNMFIYWNRIFQHLAEPMLTGGIVAPYPYDTYEELGKCLSSGLKFGSPNNLYKRK